MAALYPTIHPYATHSLKVDGLHTLYVEESGNPQGIPVLFVHGGPGGGTEAFHRRFFDPRHYRIILFDQRGCGRSTPHAELRDNTSPHLLSDMEEIRRHLNIERWLLFGGSWGSTLSLLYAQTWPERVLGLILRGIFLCRSKDIRWFYQFGASELLPDFWQDFLRPIPVAERDDLVSAYYRRLTGDDEVARMGAAKSWSIWEGRAATLEPSPSVVSHFGDPYVALSMARIECHYFMNGAFMGDGQLLRDAAKLKGIPGTIVHGRYDVVCPMEQAWELHRAWPQADLKIVETAGHAASEPGISRALVEATDAMVRRLGKDFS